MELEDGVDEEDSEEEDEEAVSAAGAAELELVVTTELVEVVLWVVGGAAEVEVDEIEEVVGVKIELEELEGGADEDVDVDATELGSVSVGCWMTLSTSDTTLLWALTERSDWEKKSAREKSVKTRAADAIRQRMSRAGGGGRGRWGGLPGAASASTKEVETVRGRRAHGRGSREPGRAGNTNLPAAGAAGPGHGVRRPRVPAPPPCLPSSWIPSHLSDTFRSCRHARACMDLRLSYIHSWPSSEPSELDTYT